MSSIPPGAMHNWTVRPERGFVLAVNAALLVLPAVPIWPRIAAHRESFP